MLTLLTKQVRGRAAGILVAAYAFGVLAPSLAFSFDSDASIIHSLTEVHGGLLMPHLHHDHDDHKIPTSALLAAVITAVACWRSRDCHLRLMSPSLTRFACHWSLQYLKTIMRLVARRGWIGLHDISH
jgi:hypothetical protein